MSKRSARNTGIQHSVLARTESSLLPSIFSEEIARTAFESVLASTRRSAHRHYPVHRARKIVDSYQRSQARTLLYVLSLASKGQVFEFTRQIKLIPKGRAGSGFRPISVFPFEQRVAIKCLHFSLWPLVEPHLKGGSCYSVHNCRKGRGISDAIQKIAKARGAKTKVYIFESDIEGFFDQIPRESLLEKLEDIIPCSDTILLIRAILEATTYEDSTFVQETSSEGAGLGIPQGASISSMLASFYLTTLDVKLRSRGFRLYRYVDDIVILTRSLKQAKRAKRLVASLLRRDYGLKLKKSKTRICLPQDDLHFLGYVLSPDGSVSPGDRKWSNLEFKISSIISSEQWEDYTIVNKLCITISNFWSSSPLCIPDSGAMLRIERAISDSLRIRGFAENRLNKMIRKTLPHYLAQVWAVK